MKESKTKTEKDRRSVRESEGNSDLKRDKKICQEVA